MKAGPYSRATKTAKAIPVSPAAPRVKTEMRNGVLYVVGRCGASPVASPAIAQSYGGALFRSGIL